MMVLQNVYISYKTLIYYGNTEIINFEYHLRSLKVVHISNFGALK